MNQGEGTLRLVGSEDTVELPVFDDPQFDEEGMGVFESNDKEPWQGQAVVMRVVVGCCDCEKLYEYRIDNSWWPVFSEMFTLYIDAIGSTGADKNVVPPRKCPECGNKALPWL